MVRGRGLFLQKAPAVWEMEIGKLGGIREGP